MTVCGQMDMQLQGKPLLLHFIFIPAPFPVSFLVNLSILEAHETCRVDVCTIMYFTCTFTVIYADVLKNSP